ncbi:MAG: hypothetical protein ACLSUC_02220 [Subdoligranulum sp.]
MSNWKIEVSIPAVRVRYIINIMMNDIKERNVSIPAVRVRYIYYHRADTQSQVHVSIPAARVRYIHHQRRQKGDSQGFNSRSAGKIHWKYPKC